MENKRDFIENCVEKNISGKHKYFINEDGKEECKHCGLLRSTIDGVLKEREDNKGYQQSPFSYEEIKKGLNTNKKEIPKEVFDRILTETKSKSAIIITFGNEIMDVKDNLEIKGFHINSVNIRGKYLKFIFHILTKALNGELGGKLNIRRSK
jgi:hypothetical protein